MTWKEFRLKHLVFITGPVKEDYIKEMAHEEGHEEGLKKGRDEIIRDENLEEGE